MRRTQWAQPPAKSAFSSARKRAIIACPLPSLARLALLYLLLVTLHMAYFSYEHRSGLLPVLCAVPLGFVLGLVFDLFNRGVSLARAWMLCRLRPLLVGFLLFFVYLIGYIVVFTLVVSFPLEWSIEVWSGSLPLAQEYVLHSVNFIIPLAVLSWLRWLFGAVSEHRRHVA